MKKGKNFKYIAIFLITGLFVVSHAYSARIKDISSIGGVRDNQLVGYGLVVGLAGTGDDIENGFTKETLANMLSRQGLGMKETARKNLSSDNVASVMISAELPPFAKVGSRIDIAVSSIGDADSLRGGTLLMTPLSGADGRVYAVAQGAVSIGGFAAGGGSKNHPTVGRITNGAFIERELEYDFENRKSLSINLYRPDFTTATGVAAAINGVIAGVEAKLVDSSTVTVNIKESFKGSIVKLLSIVENINVAVDSPAVVVIDEKTGTIVMGENVRISTVAVAHGNLFIQIKEEKKVYQPSPFAPGPPAGSVPVDAGAGAVIAPGGQTVVTTETVIDVEEEKNRLVVVPKGVTIQEVVRALNAIGVTPGDLITILQTIKSAGALQADLKVI
ncbi:MAG: flagellar basal body P-ring protein FlgI [Spirochaetales bacterium]|jgi:flagellar P-ring protein precursor FlgI|nr:flagellar basal body P-ring protein FlgI [Spirochaetales bacterium]